MAHPDSLRHPLFRRRWFARERHPVILFCEPSSGCPDVGFAASQALLSLVWESVCTDLNNHAAAILEEELLFILASISQARFLDRLLDAVPDEIKRVVRASHSLMTTPRTGFSSYFCQQRNI
jgi:hypothetical protein